MHADFIAGYYLGKNFDYSSDEISALVNEFNELGDYNFYDFNHHGTGHERACAFGEGYDYAKTPQSTLKGAISLGWNYVEADNPCIIYKNKVIDLINQENEEKRKNIYQEKLSSLNERIKNGTGGSITFRVKDNKKYVIKANNNLGYEYNYFLNQTRAIQRSRGGGKLKASIEKKDYFELLDMLTTGNYTFTISKRYWLLGNFFKTIGTFNVPIQTKKTTDVEIKEGKINYRIK